MSSDCYVCLDGYSCFVFFFFKQKTAYEMRISDWSSDVCSSDLVTQDAGPPRTIAATAGYGTGEGIRLEGSWTHRNLFPPEGALIVRGVADTQEQGDRKSVV